MLVNDGKWNDPGEILELLGNDSRRKILQLLTKKPCYVSEISYALRMAPKVVLEHLEKLENAGLVRSYEEGRRRYYFINGSINISITISPHRFSIDIINKGFDQIDKAFNEIKSTLTESAEKKIHKMLERLEKIERTFKMLQSDISSRIDELIDRMIFELDSMGIDDISKIVLYSLIKGVDTPDKISSMFGIPYEDVVVCLTKLEGEGKVRRIEEGNIVRFRIV